MPFPFNLASLINGGDAELFLNQPEGTRYFVIKSYTESDIHKAIKYNIWASSPENNKKFNEAYVKCTKVNATLYFFFSVNQRGKFCAIA
jgi:hydroxymethylglutaryl-CoA reductase